MAKGPEAVLEAKALAWLNRQPDAWATPYHVSAYAKVGKADIFACIRGLFVAIEMKATPEIDATDIQKLTGREIVHKGGLWHVAGSLAHVQAIHQMPDSHAQLCKFCGPNGPILIGRQISLS